MVFQDEGRSETPEKNSQKEKARRRSFGKEEMLRDYKTAAGHNGTSPMTQHDSAVGTETEQDQGRNHDGNRSHPHGRVIRKQD
jgi:hypothetical protein